MSWTREIRTVPSPSWTAALPLTTIQDYSLFRILGDYSIAIWTEQIRRIVQENGLISILTHPDYLLEDRARSVYQDLLTHLVRERAASKLWITLPAEVDSWWRNRHQMTLVPAGDSWRIEGPASHRGQVAYAVLEEGKCVYTLDAVPAQFCKPSEA